MRGMPRSCLLLSMPLVCLTTLTAQGAGAMLQKQLELTDLNQLEARMRPPDEEPLAFVDADSYLVFDDLDYLTRPGSYAWPGRPSWSRVDARNGMRTAHVAWGPFVEALGQRVGRADGFAEALADLDAWTWNDDHTRFVVAVAGDLFAGDLQGGVVQLTHTPAEPEVGARLSPDGAHVAFVVGHDLHVVPFAGGEVKALTRGGNDDLRFGSSDWVYQRELYGNGRGDSHGFWWSPDGKYIALLKHDLGPVPEFVLVGDAPARPPVERIRYPKAGEPNPVVEVGAIAVADRCTRWFDLTKYPADDRLVVRVSWAPDASEVLFQVQNREQTWLDLLAGDARTGTVRTLWREGSDCWVEAGHEPVWYAAGKLLLIAAAMDDNVHMQNSLQLLHALQQAGKDCDFMVYPRVRHGIEDRQQQLHLWARFLRFLQESL
jgi:dipeptidyl aminopeptidase/acylaminoacyl peptidase